MLFICHGHVHSAGVWVRRVNEASKIWQTHGARNLPRKRRWLDDGFCDICIPTLRHHYKGDAVDLRVVERATLEGGSRKDHSLMRSRAHNFLVQDLDDISFDWMGMALGFDEHAKVHTRALKSHGSVHVIGTIDALNHVVQSDLDVIELLMNATQRFNNVLFELGRSNVRYRLSEHLERWLVIGRLCFARHLCYINISGRQTASRLRAAWADPLTAIAKFTLHRGNVLSRLLPIAGFLFFG